MSIRRCLTYINRLISLLALTAAPLVISRSVWKSLWAGGLPLAWDGSGHYALAKIYDQTIFPNTFGWTHAYFSGMPFPNFYPPLFYWCVALLRHTRLFSFDTSFRLVLVTPVLLLPATVWLMGWTLSKRDSKVACGAALACLPLLLDYRFRLLLFPSGLDYVSTFQVGLYTQPLGFVLLAVWLVIYINANGRRRRFAMAAGLLALTLLANFFNAVTAAIFIIAVLANDIARSYWAKSPGELYRARQAFVTHLLSPVAALGLSLFWLAPMLVDYDYFVTRPHLVSVFEYLPPALLVWYLLSFLGFLFWSRRPTRMLIPFLASCVVIEAVIFSAGIAPRWFPLQPLRFLSTLNLLLAVPVGWTVAVAVEITVKIVKLILIRIISLARKPVGDRDAPDRLKPIRYSVYAVLLTLICLAIIPASYHGSFSTPSDDERIRGVLDFAGEHQDGLYLVEHAVYSYLGSTSDVRALTSYLGAQGNQSVSVVFREASPNAIFFNPLVGALSGYSDNFGIASVLADDIDFAEQPLDRHLEQARYIGVKYIVATTLGLKQLLSLERSIISRYDFGLWSIFELGGMPTSPVRALPYKPALVFSDFSFKQRRRHELNFVRLAEEQFFDGWFDVLLVRAPETEIDSLRELDQFGALILDNYTHSDEDRAFELLRSYAHQHPLILLSSDAKLYRRIIASISDFPLAEIVERQSNKEDYWLESDGPTYRYNESSIRKEWGEIRRILDRSKAPIHPSPISIAYELKSNAIQIVPNTPLKENTPTLIEMTFHPQWRRSDGQPIYAATPFFMLTFVRNPTHLIYTRRWLDWLSLLVSATTLMLCCVIRLREGRRPKDFRRKPLKNF